MFQNFLFLAYGSEIAAYAAIASAVVGAAGTAYSYYAAEQQKGEVRKQGEANANAIAAEQQRKAAELAENQRRKALEQRRFRASQAAQLSSTGLQMDTGSPLAIMADTFTAQSRELSDMQYAGDTQSRSLGWERSQALSGASQQARAIGTQQVSGLISGVASAANSAFTIANSRPRTTSTYGNS